MPDNVWEIRIMCREVQTHPISGKARTGGAYSVHHNHQRVDRTEVGGIFVALSRHHRGSPGPRRQQRRRKGQAAHRA